MSDEFSVYENIDAFLYGTSKKITYGSIETIGVTGTPDNPGIFYLKRKGQGWAKRYGYMTPECFAALDAYLKTRSPAIVLEHKGAASGRG